MAKTARAEARELLSGIFAAMAEVGASIHPYVLDDFHKLARLFDIEESAIFTERDSLNRTYGKNDDEMRAARIAALQRLADRDGFVIVPKEPTGMPADMLRSIQPPANPGPVDPRLMVTILDALAEGGDGDLRGACREAARIIRELITAASTPTGEK